MGKNEIQIIIKNKTMIIKHILNNFNKSELVIKKVESIKINLEE